MQNLPLNNENSKGCIRIQIDSPRNFGLRNGKGTNEIILDEFCAAKASRGIFRWHESCRPSIFSMLRDDEIGQDASEPGERFLVHAVPGNLADCAVFLLNQCAA